MTTEELRLECLRLANSNLASNDEIVARASAFYDFLIGKDRAALAEEAKAAIDRALG